MLCSILSGFALAQQQVVHAPIGNANQGVLLRPLDCVILCTRPRQRKIKKPLTCTQGGLHIVAWLEHVSEAVGPITTLRLVALSGARQDPSVLQLPVELKHSCDFVQ